MNYVTILKLHGSVGSISLTIYKSWDSWVLAGGMPLIQSFRKSG
jgi:hypothetical protein